jgi:uncharacterized membrane protein
LVAEFRRSTAIYDKFVGHYSSLYADIFSVRLYPIKSRPKALTWTLVFTAILLVPLGISLVQLIKQAQLEVSLKQALLKETITFQRVDLIKTESNWLTNPPEVYLTVRAQEVLTPKQVLLLEEFVEQKMGQPFTLIFQVSQVKDVRRESPASSP